MRLTLSKLVTVTLFSLFTATTFAQEKAITDEKLKITQTILEKISQQFDFDPLKIQSLIEIDFEYDSAYFANGNMGRHLLSTKKFDSSLYRKMTKNDKYKNIRSPTSHHPIETFFYDSILNPPFADNNDSVNKILVKIEKPISGWEILYLVNIYNKFPDPTYSPFFSDKKIYIPVVIVYGKRNSFVYKNWLFGFEITDTKSLDTKYIEVKVL